MQIALPTWSWLQLLHECLMPFNVIHDLPSSPVGRIVDLAVFLNDLLQLLFTLQLEIDHLHDRHQVEVVLHHSVFALVALQEDRLALREGSEDISVEQFVEYHSGKEKQRARLLLGWSIEKRSYVDEQRSTHGPYGAQGEGREHLLIPKWLVDFRDGGPQEQGGFLLQSWNILIFVRSSAYHCRSIFV